MDGDEKLPLLNLTPDKKLGQCDHHECRQDARYLARIDANRPGWGPGSEEETILLAKALAACDYNEDFGKVVCRCPTPRDFSLVCQMIYSPRTFFNRGAIFFEDLERMLVLSGHYQSLRLRDCAISGLTMLFPTTLDHHRRYTRNNAVRLVPATYAIDTLHLAVHFKIPQLLLAAMYTLSNYDHRFLIHGILDPTRNSEWKVVPFDSTVSINGVNINQVADIRRVPAPVRVQDMHRREREVYKNTLQGNAEERRKAAETNRAPSIVFDPEFDQREILVLVLRGRALMQTARRDIVFGFLREIPSFPDELGEIPNRRGAKWDAYGYKFSEHCTSLRKDDIQPADSVSCATVLKELMTTMWELEAERFAKNRSLPRPRHALRVLSLRIAGEDKEEWRHALCPSCLSRFKFEMKRGQQELWRRLPELFGMKSWFDVEMEGREMTEKALALWFGKDSEYKEFTSKYGGADELLYRKDTSYLDYWPVRRTA
ncbi:hypothetical protein PENSPDRAFT_353457 [Peniophora sp. CONT]|nr:hypothetical protein PENSPDRAFT_353457 [Peniophora sp. CONT]